jgi:hypothetical protein
MEFDGITNAEIFSSGMNILGGLGAVCREAAVAMAEGALHR